MRRALALLTLTLLAALGGSARAASHDEATRDRPGDFVTNRQAILYERPSVDSPILKKLPPKTIVRVVEVTEQWYRIRSTRGAGDGWIRRSYADPFSGGATVERRRFK